MALSYVVHGVEDEFAEVLVRYFVDFSWYSIFPRFFIVLQVNDGVLYFAHVGWYGDPFF